MFVGGDIAARAVGVSGGCNTTFPPYTPYGGYGVGVAAAPVILGVKNGSKLLRTTRAWHASTVHECNLCTGCAFAGRK